MASDWKISKYRPEDGALWDDFVKASRNGTFLFERGYMDYHADRFEDCSLLAFKDGKLRALLPADLTRGDETLHTHRGLTYGGWVIPVAHFDANDMMELWEAWLEWCRTQGISRIDYKPVPWIYPAIPAQEDIYALFRSGAKITECSISSAINLEAIRPFNTQQKRNLKKGMKVDSEIEEDALDSFHELLTECLRERHGVKPVHSLGELKLLSERFPSHISTYGLRTQDGLQAGVCMYLSGQVAHCQYIASTAYGRDNGLLTRLFDYLIRRYTEEGFRYFDFGTSTEDHGLVLNPGLLRQKAALGGSGVAYMRYEIEVPSSTDDSH